MMFGRAGIVALAVSAALPGMTSLAGAQVIPPKWKCAEPSLGGDLGIKWSTFECASSWLLRDLSALQAIATIGFLRNAQADPDGPAAALKKGQAEQLNEYVARRDAAALALGDAIAETMKAMNPNDPRDAERLDHVFDLLQAINKDVTDAQLRYGEALALLDEQVAGDARKQ